MKTEPVVFIKKLLVSFPLGQNTPCFYEHKVRNKNASVMTDSLTPHI